MLDKNPIRIRASELNGDVQFTPWVLPEVGSSHVIGIETKEEVPQIDPEITVLEDEVDTVEHMTLADIESIREQAYEEGFAKGREDGYAFGEKEGLQRGTQQGLDSAQETIDQQMILLESAIDCMQEPLENQREQLSELMVEMVEHVAAVVIDYEVKSSPDIILKAFSSALDLLPKQSEQVDININPLDKDHVQSVIPKRNSHWNLIPDEEISRGGCSIKTGGSLIEFQLDSRFRDVIEQLYDRLNSDNDEE